MRRTAKPFIAAALWIAVGCKGGDDPPAPDNAPSPKPEPPALPASPDRGPSTAEPDAPVASDRVDVPKEAEAIATGTPVLLFEKLQSGETIGFEKVELQSFPPVKTKKFFGKERPDAGEFIDAFNPRLENALGKNFETVHLYNGGPKRTLRGFVFHLDDTVRGIEIAKEPTLEAWLVALAASYGGVAEHSIESDGMSGSRFDDWDQLLSDPSALAIEHAPNSFKRKELAQEKQAYFAFVTPKPDELLYSKERFDAAWSSFLAARKASASKADVQPLLDLQKSVGAPLPGDFRALYEATGALPKVFFDFDLMSPSQVVKEWDQWQSIYDQWTLDDLKSQQRAEAGIYPVYVSPRWIPFIDLVGGNYLAVDLGPSDGAPYGQVIVAGRDVDSKRRIAAGITEFLEKAATYDGSETHELYSVFGKLRL